MIGVFKSLQPSPTTSCWHNVSMAVATDSKARGHRELQVVSSHCDFMSCTRGWMKRTARIDQKQMVKTNMSSPQRSDLAAKVMPLIMKPSSGKIASMRKARVTLITRPTRDSTTGRTNCVSMTLRITVKLMSMVMMTRSYTRKASLKNFIRWTYSLAKTSQKYTNMTTKLLIVSHLGGASSYAMWSTSMMTRMMLTMMTMDMDHSN
mmetsp:Transcript_1955/g.5912  ORF Transcript_1955/g.5912 Transcript_1955/m.5912 type:complete len:206 (+) Transcript_1955:33-650(+)